MKLIHKPTGQEIIEGTVLPDNSTVIYCPQPHKPSSQGKMQVGYPNGETSGLLYCSCFDCEWINREDREEPCQPDPSTPKENLIVSSFTPVNRVDQSIELAKLRKICSELQKVVDDIETLIDGYIDGSGDCSPISQLANQISNRINS